MCGRRLILLAAAFALSACVNARPDDALCPASADLVPSFAMPAKIGAPTSQGHLDILVLSGGGAWGAYGAGFLTGWSERKPSLGRPRPKFDVVTGVSTGAIIAPFALLGPDYDNMLIDAYRGTGSNALFEGRSILTLPFWTSLNDPAPLESGLDRMLTDDAIAELGQAYKNGRSLWAGAVNFDSGKFTEFDITELAADQPPEKARGAIVDRLMAASAIPGFFPPRFINGCMYMDGGVRQNLFVAEIGEAIDAAIANHGAPRDVSVYVVINGTMATTRRTVPDTLFGVGIRGFELAGDQIQLASLREIYDYAKAKDFHLYWTSADDVVAHEGKKETYDRCSAPRGEMGQFNARFTACLFDAAKEKARTRPFPWRTDRP
ncbi:MAG TPA: patatin-like phospholipase family protein [Rhizomicrobium sp.]|nr:patatin-like phospholipase family protein [Rhizomicrobium sp.]